MVPILTPPAIEEPRVVPTSTPPTSDIQIPRLVPNPAPTQNIVKESVIVTVHAPTHNTVEDLLPIPTTTDKPFLHFQRVK